MVYSRKKETEILADAMVSASVSLDDMATALHTLGCQGLKTADAADNLASVLGAYPPVVYVCEKHGEITLNEVLYVLGEKGRVHRYCSHCWNEDRQQIPLYKWSDQLTREDFEISPRSLRN